MRNLLLKDRCNNLYRLIFIIIIVFYIMPCIAAAAVDHFMIDSIPEGASVWVDFDPSPVHHGGVNYQFWGTTPLGHNIAAPVTVSEEGYYYIKLVKNGYQDFLSWCYYDPLKYKTQCGPGAHAGAIGFDQVLHIAATMVPLPTSPTPTTTLPTPTPSPTQTVKVTQTPRTDPQPRTGEQGAVHEERENHPDMSGLGNERVKVVSPSGGSARSVCSL